MCSKQGNEDYGIPHGLGVRYLYAVRLGTGALQSTMIASFHICCCCCLTRQRALDVILMSAVINIPSFGTA